MPPCKLPCPCVPSNLSINPMQAVQSTDRALHSLTDIHSFLLYTNSFFFRKSLDKTADMCYNIPVVPIEGH